MFSVTIREKSGQVYTFHFDKREIMIGRVKGNDVILPKQNISKRHALVRVQASRFIIEDLGSTNGTYVNGHRIATPVEIGEDDKVYLGDFVMQYYDLGKSSADIGLDAEIDAQIHAEVQATSDQVSAADGNVVQDQVVHGDSASVLPALEPGDDAAAIDFDGTGDFAEAAFEDGEFAGAEFAGEDDAAFHSDAFAVPDFSVPDFSVPDVAADTGHEPQDAAGEAVVPVEESTLSQLGNAATDAQGQIAAQRSAVQISAGQVSGGQVRGGQVRGGQAVASSDPNAIDANDDRMTGPVDGLSAALDAAAPDAAALDAAAVAPALDLHLDLSMPPEPSDASGLGMPAPGRSAPGRSAPDRSAPDRSAPDRSAPGRSGLGVPGAADGLDDDFVVAAGYPTALAQLYEEACITLAGALHGDAAQLSDAEWTEMEEQVVAFVDAHAAEGAGIDGIGADDQEIERLKRDLIYELAGLGPLESLLDDPSVETIQVNAFDSIWLVRQGQRTLSNQRFSCQMALTAAAERLVRASGVLHDDAATWVDGTLSDGTTIRVVWPPLCPTGPVVLIRKPRGDAASLEDLIDRGIVTAPAASHLRDLLLAGRSIALVGPPGAGRRTLLNALARHIPDHERIIATEQGVRLHLEQPQVVRLDASAGIDTVLRVTQRLRPDRVLLGACGGAEMVALIDRTCDGFAPWMGLIVGNSAEEAVQRVVNAHAVAYPGVDRSVACARAGTALDVLGVFSVGEDGPVLDHVVEVVPRGDGLTCISFEG